MRVDLNSPRSIKDIQLALSRVILPWAPDTSSPQRFIRVNGLGVQVAIVDPWLGGYGYTDGSSGWGFKSCPAGQGAAISGMRDSKEKAMEDVDDFLSRRFSEMKLLHPCAFPVDDSEDPYCDNLEDSHGCFGTGHSSYGNTSEFTPSSSARDQLED